MTSFSITMSSTSMIWFALCCAFVSLQAMVVTAVLCRVVTQSKDRRRIK